MRKIVESINILQKTRFRNIPDSACLSRRVKLTRKSVCASVKRVIVLTLIDPYSPEDDRRMISVLFNHLAHVFYSLILPAQISDMLPSGDLGKHRQSLPVALVNKILALGIM